MHFSPSLAVHLLSFLPTIAIAVGAGFLYRKLCSSESYLRSQHNGPGQSSMRTYTDAEFKEDGYEFYNPLYRNYPEEGRGMDFGRKTEMVWGQLKEYYELESVSNTSDRNPPRADWEKVLFWAYFNPWVEV